ncbi:hypothetical protein CFC21_067642 [Triticum aestivum]|uniref:SMP domain-containing protein n=3 Tax=Triticum TaxID=4564 RepID=A0A9R0U0P1_TRITD|nr:late embryogenesis abundant protein D-34-like [Triticum aestivum]KAF7060896.1 hypothetical protein CFC21_067642 [Triticum aestivum]VAI21838.1 unnamed protein product [Triticum turgidum subsp. durum]
MAQAKCGVDCQTYAQTDTCSQGRVFDAPVTVAPSDDERLAHGGCRSVVDEVQDTKVKISEALEAAARAVGDDPVQRSDVAAIHAAEARAVGTGVDIPAGIAAQAQAAADANATAAHAEDKITIGDVLKWNATAKLPSGKAVTREDAAAAVEAEAAHAPGKGTKTYGVGAALAEAARRNQEGTCRK